MLKLGHGLDFADLYSRDGTLRLDEAFLKFLARRDEALRARLQAGREDPDALAALDESELIIAIAPHLEGFLAELFGIEAELAQLAGRHADLGAAQLPRVALGGGSRRPLRRLASRFREGGCQHRLPAGDARQESALLLVAAEVRHRQGAQYDSL